MIVLLGGIDYNELRRGGIVSKKALAAALTNAGAPPSYMKPYLFRIRDDHFAMMANHEYGFSAIDAQQVTDATIRGREAVHKMVYALKKTGGVWKDIQILATSPQIGTREGRRIHGLYTVTKDDLVKGTRFDDAVCRSTFSVDIHALNPKHAGGAHTNEGIRVIPYDIPLRALIAKDVDGLMMAGRCISGDFYAHASYRVTGNAVALGEAAGKTSAVAVSSNCLLHEVKHSEIM